MSKDLTVSAARVYFNSVVKIYPALSTILSFDARIVNNPHFEVAHLKLQNKQAATLLKTKIVWVHSLLLEPQPKVPQSIWNDFVDAWAVKTIRCHTDTALRYSST